MRPLTHEERNLLEKRKAEFDEFLEGMTEGLGDFAENLELPDPAMIIAKPNAYLSSISEFMQNQDIAHLYHWISVFSHERERYHPSLGVA